MEIFEMLKPFFEMTAVTGCLLFFMWLHVWILKTVVADLIELKTMVIQNFAILEERLKNEK